MKKFLLLALLALLPSAAMGQAQVGAGQVWGNSTASRAPGKSETVTGILDRAFGSTRGAVLMRGASTWGLVAPGTAGLPWVSGGAGADSGYAALGIVGGGTGGTTQATARTGLGLGTMATQNASAVAITGGTITGLGTPSASSDAAPKSYVDSLVGSGLTVLPLSTYVTTGVLPNTPTYANGASGVGATLTAGANSTLTIDGAVAPLNAVVLVNNQASALQNGIYTVTTAGSGAVPWVLTRATYFDQPAEMIKGSYTAISSGSTQAGTSWVLSTTTTTVGTTAVNFNQFSPPGVTSIGGTSGPIALGTNLSIPGGTLTYTAPIAPTTLGGTGANTSVNSAGQVLASNGTNSNWVGTTIDVICGYTPGLCAKAFGCSQISWFGGVGDGVTDNTTPLNNWFTSLASGRGCLAFGSGVYKFNSAINYAMANARQAIDIHGIGADVSVLYWPTGNGINVTNSHNNNSIAVHDLTFATGQAGVGQGLVLSSTGTAFAFGQSNLLYNLQFRGDDYTGNSANSHYWLTNLRVFNWNNVNIDNIVTSGVFTLTGGGSGAGTGFQYGCPNGVICGVVNISRSMFQYHNVYVELDDYWEGVTFTLNQFDGQVGGVGVYVPAGGVHAGPLLQFFQNQFNVGGQQIDILSSVNQIILEGNTITTYGTGNIGAILGTCGNAIVVGNMWNVATGTSTGALNMNCANGIVGSNIFLGHSTGVTLGASSSNVNVSQNRYVGTTTPVSNLAGGANSVGLATQ